LTVLSAWDPIGRGNPFGDVVDAQHPRFPCPATCSQPVGVVTAGVYVAVATNGSAIATAVMMVELDMVMAMTCVTSTAPPRPNERGRVVVCE
jgi:hypothetical protein